LPGRSTTRDPKVEGGKDRNNLTHMEFIAIAISLIAVIVALATRNKNMQAVERLEGLVTKLNETITTEAEQQKAAIQDLRDAINNGADAVSLNRIADDLEASIDRVAAIVPNAEPVGEESSGAEVSSNG
jgi:hypothetical protein